MIFVAHKPIGISSNAYLSILKRKYKERNMGYSGTLDPFASGALIVASKEHTKLFRFIQTEPKVYQATIFLGAHSNSLDDEMIDSVEQLDLLDIDSINTAISELRGSVEFVPPKFSAKHINGHRAYELARNGVDFELSKSNMYVYSAKVVHYCHPFLTICIGISRGGYARSYAQLLCDKLGVVGTLSALCRLSEGGFVYDNQKPLDPYEIVDLKPNEFLGDINHIANGKKLHANSFAISDDGVYKVMCDGFFSIIKIQDLQVKYILNKVALC